MTTNTLMNARAGGTINICRFVIPDTSHANGAIQAVDGSVLPLGISTDQSRVRPDPDFTSTQTTEAAETGEIIKIFPVGSVGVSLRCAAAWNPGDLLMPDGNGYGVVATTGHFYGARAQTAGTIGSLCPVDVITGYQP